MLLAQLQPVLALLLTSAAVLARRVGAALDAAFVRQAALALEEQLLALAPALLALRPGIPSHCARSCSWSGRRRSYPAPLAGTAAVVRLRGDVLHAGHFQARGRERTNRRLTSGARALDVDLDLLQPLLDALAGGRVGCHLRRERRGLARALEAGAAGGLPRDHVALDVRQGDDRVVERGLDVRLAHRDVLLGLAPSTGALGSGHYFLPAFFLPATCMRLGLLRVRALVLVF